MKTAALMLAIVILCGAAEGSCGDDTPSRTKTVRTVCIDTRETRTTRDDRQVPKQICERPHTRRFVWQKTK